MVPCFFLIWYTRLCQRIGNILIACGAIWQFWMFLLKLWRWWTTQDSEVPISPDTLQVLLARFTEVVKVMNYTGQWNTNLAWYSPSSTRLISRSTECNEPHWTVWYQSRLILFEFNLHDFPKLGKWWFTLDSEIPISPDTLWVLLAEYASIAWNIQFRNSWIYACLTLPDRRGSSIPKEIFPTFWLLYRDKLPFHFSLNKRFWLFP